MDGDSVTCFLGLPNTPLDAADVAVVSVPYEATVSYGKGTAQGPAAILVGTTHLETFEEETQLDFEETLRVATLPPLAPEEGEPPEIFFPRVTETCRGLGLVPPFPLVLGGEHSVTPAVLGGIFPDAANLTVIQIDAHADLRPSYHESKYNHACAMYQTLELGVKGLFAIGIRSSERREFEFARDDPRITTRYAHQLETPSQWKSLLEELRALEGDVFLTIDIDGLDTPWCPGTGTPMPGGLTYVQTLDVLRALIRDGRANLVGADLMETTPQPHSQANEMVAAKLAAKILAYRI